MSMANDPNRTAIIKSALACLEFHRVLSILAGRKSL